MATKNKRALVSLPPEWDAELNEAKKTSYFDKTYSEMYRQLIRLGMDSLKAKHGENDHGKIA